MREVFSIKAAALILIGSSLLAVGCSAEPQPTTKPIETVPEDKQNTNKKGAPHKPVPNLPAPPTSGK
jgi:hypothetical protein